VKKNNAIIASLNGIGETERTASFRCVIALVTDRGEYTFTGRVDGRIGYEARGDNGFGYDPIFYVDGRSTAEMSDGEKDAISHRGRALRALAKEINDLI
jgi:XTP/dITP diphosphohydrolase